MRKEGLVKRLKNVSDIIETLRDKIIFQKNRDLTQNLGLPETKVISKQSNYYGTTTCYETTFVSAKPSFYVQSLSFRNIILFGKSLICAVDFGATPEPINDKETMWVPHH
jgi:hypothetical protein